MGIYIVRHYWDQSAYFRQQPLFDRVRRDTADYEDVYAHFEPNCEGNAKCDAAVSRQIRALPTNQKMVFGVGTFMAWIAGVIQMIGGGIMLAQSCGNEEEEYDGYDSQYGGYQQGIVKGNTGSTQGGAGRNYV